MSIRWTDVTDRIKALTRVATREQEHEVAKQLGVTQVTLRESLEGHSRTASLKVVTALVRRGLDAKWLLLGEVDPVLHQWTLEGSEADVERIVNRLVSDASRPFDVGSTGAHPPL